MGMIKGRNSKKLTEAEEIKKRWQDYIEEVHKKGLKPGNHDGVVTHLELDILNYDVKGPLGNITTKKTSWPGGIPAELFQILKQNAV